MLNTIATAINCQMNMPYMDDIYGTNTDQLDYGAYGGNNYDYGNNYGYVQPEANYQQAQGSYEGYNNSGYNGYAYQTDQNYAYQTEQNYGNNEYGYNYIANTDVGGVTNDVGKSTFVKEDIAGNAEQPKIEENKFLDIVVKDNIKSHNYGNRKRIGFIHNNKIKTNKKEKKNILKRRNKNKDEESKLKSNLNN
jgi:hypothetical protein